ncbi:MAG: serine--tRNA ligase [SAR202 cluster bacterium]|nr:serine--tRNA ligase [SAR202 cluster bacterium]
MFDIELLRADKESVIKLLKSRNIEISSLNNIMDLDIERRKLIEITDNFRSKRNKTSKELSSMKEKPESIIVEMRGLGDKIKEYEKKLDTTNNNLQNLLQSIPNLPSEDIPIGPDEDSNKIIFTQEIPVGKNNFEPLPHWDIGSKFNLIDFQRGVKLSGSRFYILKNKGAQLQRALSNWMLDTHIKNGYNEYYVPHIVKESVQFGAGQLPKFKDTMFKDSESKLWLIPTAEVPITNIYSNEILNAEKLPVKIVAQTPCYRNEKAAAGKDTRGIKRVHQFEKVELYQFVEPEKSSETLESMLKTCTKLCKDLGLTYRIKLLCTGDLGFVSNKTYDIEVWSPGSKEWLEVSSISNCTDFQSRRANIKYKRTSKSKTEYVHTLNGSGLALPRIIIAILESFQNEDGNINIPEILWPYTGFKEITII